MTARAVSLPIVSEPFWAFADYCRARFWRFVRRRNWPTTTRSAPGPFVVRTD